MMTSNRPDTRTHLVNTATTLFLEKSYGTISTSKICEAAAINKGTFYHFFPSKAALLIAAMEKYSSQTMEQFAEIKSSSLSPEDKVLALFEVPAKANLAWQESEGSVNGCLVSNIGHELSTVDEEIRAATERSTSALIASIKPIVEEFIDAEGISLEPQEAAEQVMAMIQGGLALAKVFNTTSYLTTVSRCVLPALRAQAV